MRKRELLDRIMNLEARIALLETRPLPGTLYPIFDQWRTSSDCGCKPNAVCHNTACPRRAHISFMSGDH